MSCRNLALFKHHKTPLAEGKSDIVVKNIAKELTNLLVKNVIKLTIKPKKTTSNKTVYVEYNFYMQQRTWE